MSNGYDSTIINFYFSQSLINDNEISVDTTWSSYRINNEIETQVHSIIDDNTISKDKTWSSYKINQELSFIDCGTF